MEIYKHVSDWKGRCARVLEHLSAIVQMSKSNSEVRNLALKAIKIAKGD